MEKSKIVKSKKTRIYTNKQSCGVTIFINGNRTQLCQKEGMGSVIPIKLPQVRKMKIVRFEFLSAIGETCSRIVPLLYKPIKTAVGC